MTNIYNTFVVLFEPYPYTHNGFEEFFLALADELSDNDLPFEAGLSAVGTKVSIDFTPPPEDEVQDAIKWAVLCIERAGGRGTVTWHTETTIIDPLD